MTQHPEQFALTDILPGDTLMGDIALACRLHPSPGCKLAAMSKPVLPKAFDTALALFRAWGAEGGKISGKSRMAKLTTEQRRAHAKKAAAARWRRSTKNK